MSNVASDQFYARLSAVPIASLFEVASWASTDVGPLRLTLHNGASFQGWICQAKREGHEWMILLRGMSASGAKSHGVTWIQGSAVMAVTVEQPETVAAFFGFGKVDPSDLEVPKTALELRRAFDAMQTNLSNLSGVQIEIDPGMWQSSEFAQSAPAAILAVDGAVKKLMAAPDAAEALRNKVARLRVVPAAEAGVTLTDRTLTVAVGKATPRHTAAQLVEEIEKAL